MYPHTSTGCELWWVLRGEVSPWDESAAQQQDREAAHRDLLRQRIEYVEVGSGGRKEELSSSNA